MVFTEATGAFALKLLFTGFFLAVGFRTGNYFCDRTVRFMKVHNPQLLKEATRTAEQILAAEEIK